MTPFAYRLIVLTHGPDFSYLEHALASFYTYAHPLPDDVLIVVDGPAQPPAHLLPDSPRLALHEQVGNCKATAACFTEAAKSSQPFVFHLEHDFKLTRHVDLDVLADVMNRNRHLAQMALVRQPVGSEVPHGGFIAQAPGWYHEHSDETPSRTQWFVARPVLAFSVNRATRQWFETRRNFTLNPTLFRPELARAFPWPGTPQCETTYGQQILAREPDMTFGLWGDGSPWCEHFGVHDGIGY